MEPQILVTKDGSHTLMHAEENETYHSRHGAIQESRHVFIRQGLQTFLSPLTLLEIGFGTGLNALLTRMEAQRQKQKVHYETIEAFPLSESVTKKLNYAEQLSIPEDWFSSLHEAPLNKTVEISPYFVLTKKKCFFESITDENRFDLIYYDAFCARVQPELWEKSAFDRMYRALKEKGVLVTYASKSSARRAMEEAGLRTEKLPGPHGKREMLRAIKPVSVF